MEQRALPFAMISVEGQTRPPPKAKGPKAVRGQKRLSTSAEALPLACEIGAGSHAPREIGAGSRGCLGLWRVRSKRDHTPSGIRAVEGVSADARPAFKGTLRQGFLTERTQSTLLGVYLWENAVDN